MKRCQRVGSDLAFFANGPSAVNLRGAASTPHYVPFELKWIGCDSRSARDGLTREKEVLHDTQDTLDDGV
jgi:hypothetical protein